MSDDKPPVVIGEPGPALESEPQALEAGEALAVFSGCLTFDDFVSANMKPAWQALDSNAGRCTACHGSGPLGYSRPDQELFDAITSNEYGMQTYFTLAELDLPDEPGEPAAVVVNEPHLTSVAVGLAPYIQHPRFPIDGPAMDALRTWHSLATGRLAAGTCEPPRF